MHLTVIISLDAFHCNHFTGRISLDALTRCIFWMHLTGIISLESSHWMHRMHLRNRKWKRFESAADVYLFIQVDDPETRSTGHLHGRRMLLTGCTCWFTAWTAFSLAFSSSHRRVHRLHLFHSHFHLHFLHTPARTHADLPPERPHCMSHRLVTWRHSALRQSSAAGTCWTLSKWTDLPIASRQRAVANTFSCTPRCLSASSLVRWFDFKAFRSGFKASQRQCDVNRRRARNVEPNA